MKQVVQNYKSGELALLDVPEPACKPGGVLVRTAFSLISTGTELMKVSEAGKSLLGKAKARPDQVAKVMQSVATNGLAATYRKVTNRLDSYTPLGYSLCGVVTEVGAGIADVSVGDVVACAGNEHALHAEVNWVPKNLYVRVPAGVDERHAAFATVGAIAMQGVRRGEPALGDVALVIGLGLIGQLVVQLLVASGVRVIGVDPDPARCELAEQLGADLCGPPGAGTVDAAVAELTAGHGVDQVYLAAGGSTNEPVELAARLARDRGTVVDIGKCSLDLPWNAYYEKELDVRFSRSYGPGRYDPSYELEGRDYPIGYVRWTERRNLECFLDLVARERVDVEPLISHVAEFDDAVETYRNLSEGNVKAVAVLFGYPEASGPPAPLRNSTFIINVALKRNGNGSAAQTAQGAGNGTAAQTTQETANRPMAQTAQVAENGTAAHTAQETENGPAVHTAQEAGNGPAAQTTQETENGPAVHTAQEAGNGPAAQTTQETENGPVAHTAQEAGTGPAVHTARVADIGDLDDPAAPTVRPHQAGQPNIYDKRRVSNALVRVGFIGAGNYASSMLLPHLVERDDVELRHVVTTSALSAANARRKFSFAGASTDLDDVLDNDDIDAVFVVTRHSSHAELTRRALLAGKAVFVEKPLALSENELAGVLAAIAESGNDRLQVGFNRRFAPLLNESRRQFGRRIGPATVRYLINAGRLDHGSWYAEDAEGTRFTGEGGHFVDTVSALVGDDPVSVYACAPPGQADLQVLLHYPDGSTAAITYATSGSPGFPKETIELVADGKVLRFDDFQRASVYAKKKWASSRLSAERMRGRDKGQRTEVGAFLEAVRTGGPMPVPVESLAATTLATLAVETSLRTGTPVRVTIEVPEPIEASP